MEHPITKSAENYIMLWELRVHLILSRVRSFYKDAIIENNFTWRGEIIFKKL